MKVVTNKKLKSITFEDLQGGDIFSYNIEKATIILLKLNRSCKIEGCEYNVVDIANGSILWLGSDAIVEPLKGAFVVDYDDLDKEE